MPLTSCVTGGKQPPPWASVSSLVKGGEGVRGVPCGDSRPLCCPVIGQQLLPDLFSPERTCLSPLSPPGSRTLVGFIHKTVGTPCALLPRNPVKSELGCRLMDQALLHAVCLPDASGSPLIQPGHGCLILAVTHLWEGRAGVRILTSQMKL